MAGPSEARGGAQHSSALTAIALRRPFVLLRFPGVFAAVAASALILAASAAAGPAFESSVGADAVHAGLRGRAGQGLEVDTHGLLAADVVAFQQRELELGVAGVGLTGPVTTVLATGARVRGVAFHGGLEPGRGRAATLLGRTGFPDHIAVLDRTSASSNGVWLPSSTATALGVNPGQDVAITVGGRQIRVPVEGIYRDLFVGRLDAFWSPVSADILPNRPGETPPPPAVLGSPTRVLNLATDLEASGRYSWEFGLGTSAGGSIGFDRAVDVADRMRSVLARLERPENPLGAALQAPGASSAIVGIADRARSTVDAIAGPVRSFSVAAEVVALVGMIAAAVYAVRRRRIEVRMLEALGAGSTRIGAGAGIECILPVIVGASIGFSIALLGVRVAGPSPTIDASAVRAGIVDALSASALAILTFGAAAAGAARTRVEDGSEGRVRRLATRMPWEVPVIVLATAAMYEIRTRGTGPVAGGQGQVTIDRLILLFPVLFIAGLAGLLVRGLMPALSILGRQSYRWPTSAYLASRRLSSAPRAALLLTTAASLAAGVLLYASSVVGTIHGATVDKARVGIGADVSGVTPVLFTLPPARDVRATSVVDVPAHLAPSDRPVALIGVDRTFAAVASWDPGFSSTPLASLVASLQTSGSRLPVLTVGTWSEPPATLVLGGFQVPVRPVASVRAFPGQTAGPDLVVSTDALQRVLASHGISLESLGTEYRAWVRGDTRNAVAYLTGLGVPLESITTARSIAEAPEFRALASSFGYMRVLGILTALVALIGILLYLQSRQRARSISYALGHRMGLTSRMHASAVGLEIGAILAIALVIGSILAFTAAALTYGRLDPMPGLPPSPALHLAVVAVGMLGVAAALVAVVGAWLVQHSATRTNVAEALRRAD